LRVAPWFDETILIVPDWMVIVNVVTVFGA